MLPAHIIRSETRLPNQSGWLHRSFPMTSTWLCQRVFAWMLWSEIQKLFLPIPPVQKTYTKTKSNHAEACFEFVVLLLLWCIFHIYSPATGQRQTLAIALSAHFLISHWLLRGRRNPTQLRSFQWSSVPVDFFEFLSTEFVACLKPQTEIIIVKRLIQGRNNATRVRTEPKLCDQVCRKKTLLTSRSHCLRDPSLRQCARTTQLLSKKKCLSGGKLLVTLSVFGLPVRETSDSRSRDKNNTEKLI